MEKLIFFKYRKRYFYLLLVWYFTFNHIFIHLCIYLFLQWWRESNPGSSIHTANILALCSTINTTSIMFSLFVFETGSPSVSDLQLTGILLPQAPKS